MDALSQLCDYLSIGTEESMVSFSIDSFVPPLVTLLAEGNSADIMLLAARALTHLMDALPASAAAIAHHNAAPPLCANLLSIEYIDLAEQSLSALEKLSVDFPQPIVRAGGFAAALSFIDFFSTGVQRVAAVTACNMCRAPPSDAIDKIVDVLPAMMNLLSSDDQRIRESMMLGFSRLADSFKTDSKKIETLCGGDEAPLLERVIGLIVPTSPPSLAPASYAAAWRLLATLSRGSEKLSTKLLSTEALIIKLRDLLAASNSPHASECLSLADALLPEVVADVDDTTGQAVLSAAQAVSRSFRRKRASSTASAFGTVDESRRKNLTENPETLLFFGETLLSSLLLYYNSSADNSARQTTLSVVTKFLGLAPASVLEPLLTLQSAGSSSTSTARAAEASQGLQAPSIAPFIAGLLGENCSSGEKLAGLSLAHYALAKLPSIKTIFAREGVVHEMRGLKEAGEKELEEKEKAAAEAAEAATAVSNALEEANANAEGGNGPESAGNPGGTAPAPVGAAAAAAAGQASATAAAGAASAGASAGPAGNPAAAMMAAFQAAASSRVNSRLAPLRQAGAVTESASAAVASVAKIVVTAYLVDVDGSVGEGDSVFATLTASAQALEKATEKDDMKSGIAALELLSATLGGPHGISTFELSRSGIVDALVNFLKGDGLSDLSRTERTCLLVKSMNTQQGTGAFSLLVTRVLGALAAEEKLPVCISDSSSRSAQGSGSSMSSGLRQLLQPFKLCLRRVAPAAGGDDLRDYSHHVVLIEPMATMASVQDFLWQRVQARGTGADGDGPPAARRTGGSPDGGPVGQEVEVDDMVLDEEEDGDGNDDVDAMDDVPELGEDDPSGGEDGLFEMDEDAQDPDDDAEGGGDGQDNERSDEDFSSGSEDMIGEDDDGDQDHEHDHDDMDGPAAFGGDQLASSLPPVELDHDALASTPRVRRSGSGAGSGTGAGGASSAAGASGGAPAGTAGGVGSSSTTRGARVEPSGSTSPSAAPRSYASALASGMHQSSRADSAAGPDGSSGPRRPGSANVPAKLNFTLNGCPIPKDSSILQAVLQSRNDGVTVGPRLWSEVYTLVYSRATTAPAVAAAASGSAEGGLVGGAGPAAAGTTPGTRRSRRLSGRSASADLTTAVPDAVATPADPIDVEMKTSEKDKKVRKKEKSTFVPERELLSTDILERCSAFVPSLFLSDGLPEPVRNIACLLKHLHWMHSVMRDSDRSDDDAVYLNVDRAIAFTSEKMNAKMRRQFSDPLALCGGVIPRWCHILAQETSFLVPFETRLMLFQSSALGVPRALHMLQLRSDSSSVGADAGRAGGMGHRASSLRESEARMNRIQRQKVRIHRSRVLESAMRVMSMYASHGTVLEVEYFDEVGTGLGPTLEFYTLVSRELQRMDLGLWRAKESVKKVELKEAVKVSSGRSAGIPVPGTGGSASAKALATASGRTRRRSLTTGMKASEPCLPVRKDRAVGEADDYAVPTGNGLIPSCIPSIDIGDPVFAQKLSYFPFIGRFVAKALSDGRLLDLRLSPVFAKLLLAYAALLKKKDDEAGGSVDVSGRRKAGEESETGGTTTPATNKLMSQLESISDCTLWREFTEGAPGLTLLRDVDPVLATSLQKLLDLGGGIGYLCLSFVLPGNEQIELVPGGTDKEVTDANVRDYVAAVVRTVLCTGVRRQAEAFLRGFGDVVDVKSLLSFQASEIELLLCGPSFEEWSSEFLVQATRCDHGFRHESSAVVSLFRVLSELPAEDQRRFVLFATGSPALPVGGLMGLHPKLTIVKRTPEGDRAPDECLPTVMTCTNYFKLPDYSSYEVTKSRLLYALREGQGSFHLS